MLRPWFGAWPQRVESCLGLANNEFLPPSWWISCKKKRKGQWYCFIVATAPESSQHSLWLSLISWTAFCLHEKKPFGVKPLKDSPAVATFSHNWKLEQEINRQLTHGKRETRYTDMITCAGQVATSMTMRLSVIAIVCQVQEKEQVLCLDEVLETETITKQHKWLNICALWLFN